MPLHGAVKGAPPLLLPFLSPLRAPEAQALLAAVAGANSQASRGEYPAEGPHPTTEAGAAASLREGFRGWRA